MWTPLVSVVLPTRDRAAWLGRAIDSVLAQTYRPIELIVVDDGSTDGTAALLEGYEDRIVRLTQPQLGAYAARNLGIERARGELIAFMDSDDAWLPHRLALQVPLFARPEVGLVYGDVVLVHPRRPRDPLRTAFQITPPARGRIVEHLVWGNCIPTVAVLTRRDCLLETGGFPTSQAVSADYVTWFRIALGHEVDLVDAVVAEYTVHSEGISSGLGRALQGRIELFLAELDATADLHTRAVLRQLLVCLGTSMALAAVRGRAAGANRPWVVAARAVGAGTTSERLQFSTMLVARQLARRLREVTLPVPARRSA